MDALKNVNEGRVKTTLKILKRIVSVKTKTYHSYCSGNLAAIVALHYKRVVLFTCRYHLFILMLNYIS